MVGSQEHAIISGFLRGCWVLNSVSNLPYLLLQALLFTKRTLQLLPFYSQTLGINSSELMYAVEEESAHRMRVRCLTLTIAFPSLTYGNLCNQFLLQEWNEFSPLTYSSCCHEQAFFNYFLRCSSNWKCQEEASWNWSFWYVLINYLLEWLFEI